MKKLLKTKESASHSDSKIHFSSSQPILASMMDGFVEKLLESCFLGKNDMSTNIASTFSSFVAPYKMPADMVGDNSQKYHHTKLAVIASSQPAAPRPFDLSKGSLENILKLAPLRKDVEVAVDNKPQKGKAFESQLSRNIKADGTADTKVNVGIKRKQSSSEFAAPVTQSQISKLPKTLSTGTLTAAKRGTPTNFYSIIEAIFQTFWNLEFDDPTVTYAFFAKISSSNSVEFGLQTFAEESCSLAVIEERIKKRTYYFPEGFESDMRLMFSNILRFYPLDHPAYQKAVNLSKSFEADWEISKQKFEWNS